MSERLSSSDGRRRSSDGSIDYYHQRAYENQSPPDSPLDNGIMEPEQHILHRNPSLDHHQEDQVAPDMEGWLYKQGDRYKTWNKRWFVLKGSNLFYFKSPKVRPVDGLGRE